MTNRPIRPLLAAALVLTGVAGCGSVSTASQSPTGSPSAAGTAQAQYPMTISNCGRDFTIAKEPQRIVGLYPGQTEILLRLGLKDRIVAQAQDGVSKPSPDLADELKTIRSLGAKTPPSKEILVSQSPDFVFSGSEYEFSTEQGFAGKDDLLKAGATPYVATAGCRQRRSTGTVEDAFSDLRTLGKVLGRADQAAELEKQARADLAAVTDRIAGRSPVKTAQVFYEGGKLYAIGAAIEVDMLRLAGGRNVFAPTEQRFADFYAAEINAEVVLERNPDAFVFAVQNDEHQRQTVDYLTRTFPGTPAVRTGRLVGVRNATFAPGTLASIEGVATIADGLHPKS
ncbi:periplasmic binding protein [Kribbella flavida DSM 17836]|uniref:Periplasmic binding protein n=1 Tax=Kribbella flavida (strain DSM 17836 / JCM 10339 / NBRC 14399) TaxID=479435 RepID=D2PWM1_KRIFD|nr:ABC transporter substrate-binding protein [Kribbella flavida]ADB33490.1 periplasmic binding protein [Kribbella flavida DSM 17836]